MYDYKLLEAFTAVIEQKGFDKAASALFITQSAVSQRIRLLEEQVGQILLVRENPPRPTDAGKQLISHFKKVKLLESELDDSLQYQEADQFINISIGLNADTLATWFFDAVEDVIKKHKILPELHVDDQEETHRMLKDGEVAGCVTTRDKPFQSCSCSYIGTMTYRMYASPELYKQEFEGKSLKEIVSYVPVIIYSKKDTLHSQMFAEAIGDGDAECNKLYVPSVEQYLDAVLRGFGIGMIPDNQCIQLLKDGKLIDAFAPYTVKTKLYWHCWSIDSKPLNVITKAIVNCGMLI
jgi:LysR family transcriptional regulator (chromosome initiation inhibitor)